jgi:outer membrane protein OmpA-like peptidoglycan-associated protein
MMKRHLILLWLLLCCSLPLKAQQRDFEWRLGVSGGYTNYYGDLTPYKMRGLRDFQPIHHMLYFNEHYFDRLSYRLSLERQLNSTIGFEVHYGFYEFAMSDRYIQRDGTLFTTNPNWNRGLNFKNRTQDAGISLVFKSDNDRLLSSDAFLAPYLSLGAGVLLFDVWGDLLNESGQRYDHAAGGQIHNGIFETNLPPLQTEVEGGYSLTAFYTSLGLGFRIRLGSRLELFAQSNLMYTFTDFLDDVSGNYPEFFENDFQAYAARPGTNVVDPQNPRRGDPNSPNDWIIYHGVGLKINMGKNRRSFSAPRVSTFYPVYSGDAQASAALLEEPTQTDNEESAATANYTYHIYNIAESAKLDSLVYRTQLQEWRQEIQRRDNQLLSGSIRKKELTTLEDQFRNQTSDLRLDENLSEEEKNLLLEEAERPRFTVRYAIDSLQRRENEINQEIDSLNNLIKEHRPQQQRIYVLPNNDTIRQSNGKSLNPPAVNEVGSTRSDSVERDKENLNRTSEENPTKIEAQRNVRRDRSFREESIRQQSGDTIAGLQTSNVAASPPGNDLQTRRQNADIDYQRQAALLAQENQYLRYERDRLISNMYAQNNSGSSNNPVMYGSRPVSTLPSQQRESGQQPEANQRLRWWPFAAAGGMKNRTSSNQQNANVSVSQSIPLQDSLQKNMDHAALAITSAQLGLPVSTGLNFQNPDSGSEKKASDSIIYKTDTLLIEREVERLVFPTKTNVFFEINQAAPDPKEIGKLKGLAEAVKSRPDLQLVLTAFTDNTGNSEYNLALAEKRMEAVKDALIELYGLNPEMIRTESGGQVVRGAQRKSNEKDRRVEARLDSR